MLVSLKTLQDDIFTVEIDPSQTVKCFKEKIEKVKGDKFPAKNMKLMYAGKFLLDNKKVSDYNVEEKKFVIVVVKKPKPAAAAAKESEVEPESSTETAEEGGNDTANGERTADETLIEHITELGFSRNEVIAALAASFNNPDRAVEYLINGAFPSSSNDDAETEARRRNPDHTTDSAAAHLLREFSVGSAGGGSGSDSDIMPSHERIMQIFTEAMDESNNQTRAADSALDQDRDLITQTFDEMEAAELVGSVGSSTRSGTFPSMMPDSSMFSSDRMFDSFSNAFSDAGLSFAGNLMDRDHDAIERLKQLGFSDQKAIEAYFVCERNENAAADYLFSQNFE